jgi:hypothetical protein
MAFSEKMQITMIDLKKHIQTEYNFLYDCGFIEVDKNSIK